jgi:hypothetical protein
MSTFSNNLEAKISHIYECKICDYSTNKKSNYNKHCESIKHKNGQKSTFSNNLEAKISQKILVCENCEKIFKERTGLWRHKKKCSNMYIDGINIKDKDALVFHLLKQNGELQSKLIELSSVNNITTNNSHNTTTMNSHNKSFNLQFFLNETCKDAMNISDFVSSIKVSLEDLENTGRRGYVEGISNIIIKRLNELEEHFRPIHCSDTKREVFYIKDNNEWQKEKEEKPILTKAIKVIANENIKQIKNWQEKYPDCMQYDSNKNNLYLKIVSNSMNGLTKEEGDKNIEKIISNVAKETIILK